MDYYLPVSVQKIAGLVSLTILTEAVGVESLGFGVVCEE